VSGCDALVVNWNSGHDLRCLLDDLAGQRGVELHVTVVDNGSTDDSLEEARGAAQPFALIETGANLGYTGGNGVGMRAVGPHRPVLVVNPDVRFPHEDALARLLSLLDEHPRLAAIAPVIRVDGLLEHLSSVADVDRVRVHHVETFVEGPAPALAELEWIDGAVVLFRPEALQEVGGFDERFFLFQEEVDWCLRARRAGWQVALAGCVEVAHRRSSSFGSSQKGAYYYWRNLYLLCAKHARGRIGWRLRWLAALFGFARRRTHLRSGASTRALRGGLDALLGRWGSGPEDQAATSA
jgi:N-acetylglucosaminyl-diphospho-decaprenol L-rhamnosyltransferase